MPDPLDARPAVVGELPASAAGMFAVMTAVMTATTVTSHGFQERVRRVAGVRAASDRSRWALMP